MKRSYLVLAVLWAVLVCPVHPGETSKTTAAANRVLDDLHQAASVADGELYFSLFADGAVFMGTDVSERWSMDELKAFAGPYFSQGRGWTYVVKERFVDIADDGVTAWFDEVLWNDSYGTCRGTGVLVSTPSGWRISQYSLSIPIPNDLAGTVTRSIKQFNEGTNSLSSEKPLIVFLVRHAEKVDSSPDSTLSSIGKERAAKLAMVLGDAAIEHLHSSDFIRTRDTAAPLADDLGLEVEIYDPHDLEGLIEKMRTTRGRHLVVGHSDTTPAAVELLGGDPHGPIDSTTEFDRLYTVVSALDGTVTTVLTRYGSPAAPSRPN